MFYIIIEFLPLKKVRKAIIQLIFNLLLLIVDQDNH